MTSDRPKIFIGSSVEGLSIAKTVKKHLGTCFEVDIWDEENKFQFNQSTFDSLINDSNFYDFAIFIATPDGKHTFRRKTYKCTRENVIFEFGLFLGRLGLNRTFILYDERVQTFSDFEGITCSKFSDSKTLMVACKKIRATIKKNKEISELGFFPSTALAIGYFRNFIRPVVKILNRKEILIKIDGKQKIIRPKKSNLSIIYLDKIQNYNEIDLESIIQNKDLQKIEIITPRRPFSVYIKSFDKADNVLNLYDFPTPLNISAESIDMLFHKPNLSPSVLEKLENRELQNFKKALLQTITRNKLLPEEEKMIRFGNLSCLD